MKKHDNFNQVYSNMICESNQNIIKQQLVKGLVGTLGKFVKPVCKTAFSLGSLDLSGMVDGVKDLVSAPFDLVKEVLDLPKELADLFEKCVTDAKDLVNKHPGQAAKLVPMVKEFTPEMIEQLKKKFGNIEGLAGLGNNRFAVIMQIAMAALKAKTGSFGKHGFGIEGAGNAQNKSAEGNTASTDTSTSNTASATSNSTAAPAATSAE